MASKAVYIIVRLDLEHPKADNISDDEVREFIDEMGYSFTAPEGCDMTIADTEICGLND